MRHYFGGAAGSRAPIRTAWKGAGRVMRVRDVVSGVTRPALRCEVLLFVGYWTISVPTMPDSRCPGTEQ